MSEGQEESSIIDQYKGRATSHQKKAIGKHESSKYCLDCMAFIAHDRL